jgi:hypothetical protein
MSVQAQSREIRLFCSPVREKDYRLCDFKFRRFMRTAHLSPTDVRKRGCLRGTVRVCERDHQRRHIVPARSCKPLSAIASCHGCQASTAPRLVTQPRERGVSSRILYFLQVNIRRPKMALRMRITLKNEITNLRGTFP